MRHFEFVLLCTPLPKATFFDHWRIDPSNPFKPSYHRLIPTKRILNPIKPSLLLLNHHHIHLLLLLIQPRKTQLVPVLQTAPLLSQLGIASHDRLLQTFLVAKEGAGDSAVELVFGDGGEEAVVDVVLGEGCGFFVSFEGAAGVPHLCWWEDGSDW